MTTDCDTNILNIIDYDKKENEVSLLKNELNLIDYNVGQNNLNKIEEINLDEIDFGEVLNDYVEKEEKKPVSIIKIGKKKK